MYARFSVVLMFNPAALTLSAVIERAASFLHPDTLHVTPLSMRPKQVTLTVLVYILHMQLLLKFLFIQNVSSAINLFFFAKVSWSNSFHNT